MLTCKDVCDNATRMMDGKPGLMERISLRFHLLLCKQCRRFMRQFKIMVDTSADLGDVPPPSDEQIDQLVSRLSEADS